MQPTLIELQRQITALAPMQKPTDQQGFVTLGAERADAALGSALARGALHEMFAAQAADAAALTGFCAGLAQCISGDAGRIVWIRQGFSETEAGPLFMPGLAALGLDEARTPAGSADGKADELGAIDGVALLQPGHIE